MDGETGKEFAAVKIVLRKAGEPQPGEEFVTLLHEVAALVDFSQKQADGNVFGDVAFDAPKFTRGFVDPHEAAYFGEDGSEARSGFEGRVGIHSVFGKSSFAALFGGDKSEQERMVRGVDEVVAIFLLLRIFFQSCALRSAVVDVQSQRPCQALQVGAISGGILRFAIGAKGNPDHACSRRNDARYFYRQGRWIAGILAGLDAFDAFLEIQGGLAFLLVGDDALEELWFRRPNRKRGIR